MTMRAAAILFAFMVFTVPLMPLQAAFVRWKPEWARAFPHWYHRRVCRLLGVSLAIDGAVVRDAPVLLVANHASWLDIPVLSAVAPVSFVAKKEVATWPFVSWLAKLQRSVFVDRERRTKVGETASEITSRLAAGDAIVLFAEGTSSDGNRVLPFKTSLFAAAKPAPAKPVNGTEAPSATLTGGPEPVVQTISILYARRYGLPLGWAGRRRFGYYGDVAMGENALDILSSGPLTATIKVSAPVPLSTFKDRKDLAQWAEMSVRTGFAQLMRG